MTRFTISLVACAGCATELVDTTDREQPASSATKRIYFGFNEVHAGHLKSETGELPSPGETVVLQVDLDLAQSFLCGGLSFDLPLGTGYQACRGIDPELFVRFRSDTPFVQVTDGVPAGGWVPPLAVYGVPVVLYPELEHGYGWFEVELAVPSTANRIEVYEHTGRVLARCRTTHTADQRECFHVEQLAGGYISNYGANFQIEVQ